MRHFTQLFCKKSIKYPVYNHMLIEKKGFSWHICHLADRHYMQLCLICLFNIIYIMQNRIQVAIMLRPSQRAPPVLFQRILSNWYCCALHLHSNALNCFYSRPRTLKLKWTKKEVRLLMAGWNIAAVLPLENASMHFFYQGKN